MLCSKLQLQIQWKDVTVHNIVFNANQTNIFYILFIPCGIFKDQRSSETKYCYISGRPTKRKLQSAAPPLLPSITRVTTLKMLGVIILDKLSVSDHIQNIVSSWLQSANAIRTLHAHDMRQEAIQTIFCCAVAAKLRYAAKLSMIYPYW